MEEEKIKLCISKPEAIARKWIKIMLLTYLPIAFIIGSLVKFFIETDLYGVYYQVIWIDLLYVPGFSLFLICLIVNELIYFYKCKRNKKVIILIIILSCICGVTYKFMPYSETYDYYKDLHYVMEGTYCEDVQELKNVYVNVITGKWSTKTLYIETSDFKFQVGSNIVDEENFDSFKAKFKNIKKVKIEYLPNTETLLSIIPVKDEK